MKIIRFRPATDGDSLSFKIERDCSHILFKLAFKGRSITDGKIDTGTRARLIEDLRNAWGNGKITMQYVHKSELGNQNQPILTNMNFNEFIEIIAQAGGRLFINPAVEAEAGTEDTADYIAEVVMPVGVQVAPSAIPAGTVGTLKLSADNYIAIDFDKFTDGSMAPDITVITCEQPFYVDGIITIQQQEFQSDVAKNMDVRSIGRVVVPSSITKFVTRFPNQIESVVTDNELDSFIRTTQSPSIIVAGFVENYKNFVAFNTNSATSVEITLPNTARVYSFTTKRVLA